MAASRATYEAEEIALVPQLLKPDIAASPHSLLHGHMSHMHICERLCAANHAFNWQAVCFVKVYTMPSHTASCMAGHAGMNDAATAGSHTYRAPLSPGFSASCQGQAPTRLITPVTKPQNLVRVVGS